MFQQLDPRVRLLWWLGISILAMSFSTAQTTMVLVLLLYLTWQSANLTRKFISFTIKLIPFLLVISIVSLFPTFDIERAMRMMLRFHVLLGATVLVMNTTGYGELTNAFRNLRVPKALEKPVEVFALIFGLAFQTVPIASEEWARMNEIQKARGINITTGSKLQQVHYGLAMFPPLMLRIMERIKNFSIAVIIYGYDPFRERTLYHQLILTRADKVMALAVLATTIAGITLAFTFKV